MKQRAFDVLGNIAIVNFPRGWKNGRHGRAPNQVGLKENLRKRFLLEAKQKFANKILKENKSIKTILEKKGKIKGRLRKLTTIYVAGEKTKEVLYRENGCVFRFNIDNTYFSPRLSNERKEIAGSVKKNDLVLVMFAGVGPFSIVIGKNSPAKKIYSNEINREANKYCKLNIELNKLKDKVEIVPGDVKRVVGKLKKMSDFGQGVKKKSSFRASRKEREENKGLPRFDVIVMPRPQLKETFLKEAFKLSKKGTKIFYYDFCDADKIDEVKDKIKNEAKKCKKKIRILKTKTAGEIAPYRVRVRVDFMII